jgi:hypothetical protein
MTSVLPLRTASSGVSQVKTSAISPISVPIKSMDAPAQNLGEQFHNKIIRLGIVKTVSAFHCHIL